MKASDGVGETEADRRALEGMREKQNVLSLAFLEIKFGYFLSN